MMKRTVFLHSLTVTPKLVAETIAKKRISSINSVIKIPALNKDHVVSAIRTPITTAISKRKPSMLAYAVSSIVPTTASVSRSSTPDLKEQMKEKFSANANVTNITEISKQESHVNYTVISKAKYSRSTTSIVSNVKINEQNVNLNYTIKNPLATSNEITGAVTIINTSTTFISRLTTTVTNEDTTILPLSSNAAITFSSSDAATRSISHISQSTAMTELLNTAANSSSKESKPRDLIDVLTSTSFLLSAAGVTALVILLTVLRERFNW